MSSNRDNKDNSKRFWSYIKSKRQEPAGISPLLNKDGFLHSDSQIKAEILNNIKGVMRASFQSDGTVPEFSDVWKTRTMTGANSEAHNFNSLVGI
jgi:pantothenate kinase